tara:strand:+ start:50 stop:4294 length:4245 start_codon:yes stop_codon:yes gene_type:complete
MPEVKNTFIGAKMNKDLNPRLVPSKEYIDAKNAAVLNSENGDSGLLQNVDGNTLLTSLGLTDENLEIIGFYIDRALDRMFVFVTNWNDTSLGDSTRFASEQSSHYICMYTISSGQSTVLVSGSFLNFNKSSRMLGINLLEDLLFFTDNRNQPRKINVKLAAVNTSYYTEESNISVLKYFPWKAPQLSKNKLSSNQTNKYPLLLNSEFIIKTNFTGATDGTYTVSPATDGNGSGTELKIKVVGGKVDTATVRNQFSGDNYAIGDTLTVTGITGQIGNLVVTIGSQNIAQLPTLQDVISPDLPGAVKLTNVRTLQGAAAPGFVEAFAYGNPIKINYNLNAFRSTSAPTANNIVKPIILTQWDGIGTQTSNKFLYSSGLSTSILSGTGLVLSITNNANDFQIIVAERGNNYCEGQKITITSVQMPGLSPTVMDLTLTPRAGENPFESLEYDSFKNGIITSKSSSGVDKLTLSDNITVTQNVATNPSGAYSVPNTIEFSPVLTNSDIANGDIMTVGANPDYDGTYDGNNDFISDKFIKFSYRFKFEDNEHSLIAPFSQAAFIPKQDGYFLEDFVPKDINDDTVDSDENRAIKSTIIAFFENKVNKAGIVIDMPEGVDTPADLYDKLKVVEIDILYKDSDETGIRLIDTITKDELIDLKTNQYIYDYKSSMPIQTLRSVDFSRVSDKAPIRAKAQEIAGNRVMYGNYLARTTRPNSLSYNISASPKQAYGTYNSFDTVQYPNHNLKQNRSYEVGIVLADKFGRQSDVITSDNSTVFNNYRQSRTGLNSWMGDSLKISWTNSIPTTIGTPGYAGLYSETNPLGWYSYKVVVKQTAQDYYNIYLPTILNNTPASNTLIINPISFINEPGTGGPDILSVSLKDAISSEWLGSILTGTDAKFTAGTGVELIEISGDGTILTFNNPSATKNMTLGEGILTIPNFDPPESPNLAYVTLFSDNINKAPRDLEQVASDDITFSSSVEVYGRVWNNRFYQYKSSNLQFFPNDNKISDKITRVGTRDALGLNENSKGYITSTSPFNTIPSPYEKGGNPFIGEVATQRSIGATGGKAINPYVTFENVRLNVYETAPFESNLDIYYESSSSGLISELNSYIAQDSSVNQPAGLIDWSWQLRESDTPGTYVNLAWFDVSNSLGDSITSNNLTGQIVSVTNRSGAGFGVNLFTLERNEDTGSLDQYKFKLKISANNYFVFNNLSATNDRYIFTFRFTNLVSGISYIENVTTVINELDNVAPGFIGEQSPFTPYPNSPVELFTTDMFSKGALDERTFNGTNGTASTLSSDFKEGLEWEVTNVEFYWDAYSEWRPYKPYFNFSPINNFGVYMTINKDTFLQPYNNINETLSYNSIFTCLNTASQSEGNGTGLFNIIARNNTQFRVSLRLFDASGINGSLSTSSTAQFTLIKNTNR